MKKHSLKKTISIEEIKQHYNRHKKGIRTRIKEFRSVLPSGYFYELVYCFLTPQSSAANAEQAVKLLRLAGFRRLNIDPEPILRKKEHYIRFHRKKSIYLLKMKEQFPLINQKLSEHISAADMREWIVKNVNGLGYKEATHFLRNIGKNDGLSILDRHILRVLKELNIIRIIPVSMNKRHYLQIERRFIEFAKKIGIVLDELDLVLWSMGTGEIRK